MKVIVQEIINKFLDLEHVFGKGQHDTIHGDITKFKDLKILSLLNTYPNQQVLSTFIITYDFYKWVVEEIFFHLGEIIFGTDMIGENAY